MNNNQPSASRADFVPPRRSFIVRAGAVAVGALVSLVPLASGLMVFLDPLRRYKAQAKKLVRVASLETVPSDGEPCRVAVIDTRVDAWNRYPPAPIGSVFLRRESAEAPLKAYSTVCPHFGCSVDFKTERNEYVCPCHNSVWNVDGTRVDPLNCPAPRDLDTLDVEVRNEDEVWVHYQKFRGGIERKIAE